jgi:hypothetical protein
VRGALLVASVPKTWESPYVRFRQLELAGRLAALGAAALVALQPAIAAQDAKATPADLVLSGGKIYTVDPARSTAAALAVKNGKVVFVGSAADAQRCR